MVDTALPDPSELIAARDALAPQLRGLAYLLATMTSDDVHEELAEVNARRHHRNDLLSAALAARSAYMIALDALANDGYPALPDEKIATSLLAQVKAEEADIEAAVAIFEAQQAATIAVSLGAPVPKT